MSTKHKSPLITRVNDIEDGQKALGEFVEGVRDKLRQIMPHLDDAAESQVADLWHLATSIEGTIALNRGNIRKNEALASMNTDESGT